MTDAHASDGAVVRDDVARKRFVVEQRDATAELAYDMEPGRLLLVHTEVPAALGGRGVGGRLVRAAVDRARDGRLTIVPWCPFARRWLREHPDALTDVSIDWKARPPSTGSA